MALVETTFTIKRKFYATYEKTITVVYNNDTMDVYEAGRKAQEEAAGNWDETHDTCTTWEWGDQEDEDVETYEQPVEDPDEEHHTHEWVDSTCEVCGYDCEHEWDGEYTVEGIATCIRCGGVEGE